jgi:hypothetical protein
MMPLAVVTIYGFRRWHCISVRKVGAWRSLSSEHQGWCFLLASPIAGADSTMGGKNFKTEKSVAKRASNN